MKRCVLPATLSLVAILCLDVSPARAQAPAAQSGSRTTKASISVSGGPTLGNKSAGFVAVEFGWRLTDKIDVCVEGGHMGNVGTRALDDNARVIADAIGASVGSTGIKVNHFDAGIRFNVTPPRPNIHPYVVLGIGAAKATTEVTFTNSSGTVIDPGFPLGGALAGSNTKPILALGGGSGYPFMKNYFVDVGYRFGGILSKVEDIENDQTIKTQRIMLGAGVRF